MPGGWGAGFDRRLVPQPSRSLPRRNWSGQSLDGMHNRPLRLRDLRSFALRNGLRWKPARQSPPEPVLSNPPGDGSATRPLAIELHQPVPSGILGAGATARLSLPAMPAGRSLQSVLEPIRALRLAGWRRAVFFGPATTRPGKASPPTLGPVVDSLDVGQRPASVPRGGRPRFPGIVRGPRGGTHENQLLEPIRWNGATGPRGGGHSPPQMNRRAPAPGPPPWAERRFPGPSENRPPAPR